MTTENWATICAPDSSLLCAIAMLDPSAATFDADLKLAHAVAAGATAEPFSFMWADGTCELAFADAFDVQPPKLPTVVALSPKKRRFAGFVGGFEEAPVRQFLTGILTGRRKTSPISDIPLPEHTAEKCAELAAENAAAASADAEAGDDGELDDLMAEIRAEEEAAKKAQEAELAAERRCCERPRRTPRPRRKAKRARRRRKEAAVVRPPRVEPAWPDLETPQTHTRPTPCERARAALGSVPRRQPPPPRLHMGDQLLLPARRSSSPACFAPGRAGRFAQAGRRLRARNANAPQRRMGRWRHWAKIPRVSCRCRPACQWHDQLGDEQVARRFLKL